MARTDSKKIEIIYRLLDEGLTYREIQGQLQQKFGSGVSYTTLKKLNKETPKVVALEKENTHLKEEVKLFKRLYFELLDASKQETK